MVIESSCEELEGKFMLQNVVRQVIMIAREIKAKFTISPKGCFISVRHAYT
jgi:hypothetical protein